MRLGRAARVVGLSLFALVAAFLLFAFFVVASIRCCAAAVAPAPADAGEWIAVALAILLLLAAAAFVGLVAAALVEGLVRLAARLRAR